MTQALARSAAPSQLLSWLLEEPQLVQIVQAVDGSTLARLVQHIGLEDSGELLALATPEQLTELFDEDLWRPRSGEGSDAFDPDRFGAWLEVMIEMSPERAAKRASELDEDLLLLALCKHVRVVDLERARVLSWAPPGAAFGKRMREALDAPLYREFDSYLVCSIADQRWTAFSTLLGELDRHHDDLLRRLLERCADLGAEDEEEQDYEPDSDDDRVLDLEEMLGEDVAAAREERRERAGYVSPSDAMRFLAACRATPLDELLAERELDVASRVYAAPYFAAAAPRAEVDSKHNALPGSNVRSSDRADHSSGGQREARPSGTATPPPSPTTAAKVAELLQAMRDAELLPQLTHKALPGSRQDAKSSVLQDAMAELRSSHPDVYERRVLELSYAANVLLSGCSFDGEAARPVDAAEAALAISGLGLERALRSGRNAGPSPSERRATIDAAKNRVTAQTRRGAQVQADAPLSAATQLLRVELLQLFCIGFHILHEEVAMPAARALEEYARRCAARATTGEREEYSKLADSIAGAIERERPLQARPHVTALQDGRDAPLLTQLMHLLDPCPTLGDAAGVTSHNAARPRFIGSERDIEAAAAKVRALSPNEKTPASKAKPQARKRNANAAKPARSSRARRVG